MERFALTLAVCALAAPTHAGSCPDLSGDGIVDSLDLNILLVAFGSTGAGDLTGDGITDSLDLNTLLAQFGASCNAPTNDLCTNATPIALGQIVGFTLDGATLDGSACPTQPVTEGVWFSIIGTGDELNFSVNAPGITIVLAAPLETTEPCGAQCCIATNEDTMSPAAWIGGPCCDPASTPGCGDDACEQAICAIDSSCCEVAWDASCAMLAADVCGCDLVIESSISWCSGAGLPYRVLVIGDALGFLGATLETTEQGCSLPPVGCVSCASSVPEAEVCGQADNDTPATAQPIASTGFFCGAAWSDGSGADVDHYVLTMESLGYRTVQFKAESACQISLAPLEAPDLPLDTASTVDCQTMFLNAQLPAGDYLIRVDPEPGTTAGCPTACQSQSRYLMTIFSPF